MNHVQWLAFVASSVFKDAEKRKLYVHFGGLEKLLIADLKDLRGQFEDKLLSKLETLRNSLNYAKAEQEMQKLRDSGSWVVTVEDPAYPESLLNLSDFPWVLFGKGRRFPLYENSLSVVGPRRPSHYGKRITRELVSEIATQKISIISGMARGIDTLAHEAALTNGAHTVAVWGTGLGHVYPRENKNLAKEIEKNGTLITEFFFDEGPMKYHFPKRNRIVAALSKGLLVIEGTQKSGARISSDFALQLNRDIYAIPGPIDVETSFLPNHLISQGGKLVADAKNILEDYGKHFGELSVQKSVKEEVKAGLTPIQRNIFEYIKNKEPAQLDNILSSLKIDLSVFLVEVDGLESLSLVKRELDGRYTLN